MINFVNPPHRGQHEADRELRHRLGVSRRSKENRDLPLGGKIDADVERIPPRCANHFQATALDHLFVNEIGFDDENVGAGRANPLCELLSREVKLVSLPPVLVDDLHFAAEVIEGLGIERGCNVSFHWITLSDGRRRAKPRAG